MPLYEFECTECHSAFEELVRISAAVTDVVCPKCGSVHVRRKVSTFASKTSGGSGYSSSASSCAPSG